MFKRFLQFNSVENPKPLNQSRNGGTINTSATANATPQQEIPAEETATSNQNTRGEAPGVFASFSEIYRNGQVTLDETSYNILKVADMINSSHLSGLSVEAKQGSLLMAFEAAGVEVETLLHDAMLRQRALGDYEEQQRAAIKDFEESKTKENTEIQAELERITAEYMGRIQSNHDDVARLQDQFDTWQRNKQKESQRIAEAAAMCVRNGVSTTTSNLTTVLERAAAAAAARR
jgi:hypothetical protein